MGFVYRNLPNTQGCERPKNSQNVLRQGPYVIGMLSVRGRREGFTGKIKIKDSRSLGNLRYAVLNCLGARCVGKL